MSRSLSPVQATLLGLVVLVALVLGGYGLFAVGSRQWLADAFVVTARVKDAQRIEPGTRVFVLGKDAGWVEDVELGDGEVYFTLRLAGSFRRHIPKDSKVQIAGDSFFAGKVVNIVRGTPGAGLVADGDVLGEAAGGDLVTEIKQEIQKEIQEIKKTIADAKIGETVAKLNSVLTEANTALKDFNQGAGPIGEVTQDLKKATGKLNDALAKADSLLTDVQQGKGTVGQLVKDKEVYKELVKSIQDTRQMVKSVNQNAEAIKSLPVIRSYVVDINRELNRPDCKRYRLWFEERRLFEPGRAVLTQQGKAVLDSAAQWLNDRKAPNSEVVIAAFADPAHKAEFAQTLTQKQSEAVAEYLKNTHKVHRMGFWWWSNRTVKALGCGNVPTPVPETERLAPARIELIVFVPET